MSSVRETRLWTWLKKARFIYKERLDIERIENSVGSGTPDVQGCFDGGPLLIELKCEPSPHNSLTHIKPRFRPAQPPWHRRRAKAGGVTFVLLQIGAAADARRYLFDGRDITMLQAGMPEKELQTFSLCLPKDSAGEILEKARDHVKA